ncbi:MAG: hypothetical protein U9O85_02995 [Euryarchaeota archaeon]|nr:hypothetical protein [Euryarchaeota archaeon]
MEKTKTKIAILGIAVLFAVLTVSTASAVPTVHFVPQDISVPEGYCNTRNVEVRINLSAADTNFGYGQFGFSHDPLCGDITSRTLNTDIMTGVDPGWSSWNQFELGPEGPHVPNHCWDYGMDWIVFSFWIPHNGPDDLLVGNFTIHCNSSEYCKNDLNFGCLPNCLQGCILMWDHDGNPLTTSTINGTFECGTPAATYTISGYANTTGEPGGVPAKTVNITNLNESKDVEDRPADYIGDDGFYNLTLNVPSEVGTGDELLIVACDVPSDNESNCNHTIHTVTEEEINAGGVSNVNLILNHYCLNYYPTFPFHTWNESNWSGPAAMEMLIDHYLNPPWVPNQTVLNETGIGNNQDCNNDIQYVDPRGMRYTLNHYLYWPGNPEPRVAHYGIGKYNDNLSALHYICYWQHLGPGAAPAYGDYSNWMVIRGIHTSEDPYPGPYPPGGNYDVYGFWINDPKDPGGIGENTYKTVDQWTSTYYFNLTDIDDPVNDTYYNKYVAVCEPPEQPDVEVKAVHSPARLEKPVDPELMGLDVVKAAIDGVTEGLVPYDAEFAAVFAKTIAGEPMLVTDDDGNEYYLVPFEVPVEKRPIPIKKPVEIQKVEGRAVKLLSLDDEKAVIKSVPVRPIRPIKEERTLVVVLVDAEDGSFKEASWVADPVKYLPVSKVEALELVFKEMRQDRFRAFRRPVIELVHRDASPYSPDWKITIGQMVFYVSQDGTVSYDKPAPKPTLRPKPIKPGPIPMPF